MMLILPDKQVDLRQLNEEIANLGIPGFTGVARLSRDLTDGSAIAPYLLIKCGVLDAGQEAAVTSVVNAHVPTPRTKRDFAQELNDARDLSELKAVIQAVLGLY